MPASNPYNPYFGPGLMPIGMSQEHAANAAALAGSHIPSAMALAANAGTQPQKRTDRVQVMPFMSVFCWCSSFFCAVYAGLCVCFFLL